RQEPVIVTTRQESVIVARGDVGPLVEARGSHQQKDNWCTGPPCGSVSGLDLLDRYHEHDLAHRQSEEIPMLWRPAAVQPDDLDVGQGQKRALAGVEVVGQAAA